MQLPLYAAHTPRHVLLLSEQEDTVRTEVRTLRALSIPSVQHCKNATEVLSLLEERSAPHYRVDVLVCDEKFAGHSIYHFLYTLATKASLTATPVLLIVATPEQVDKAKKYGLTALCRPYTQENLSAALTKAMSPARQPLSTGSLQEFKSGPVKKHSTVRGIANNQAKSVAKTTTDYLHEGVRQLKAGDVGKAEKSFQTVLQRQYEHPEAHLHLARVYQKRGDTAEVVHHLLQATATYMRSGNREKAEAIRAFLPEKMWDGSIFLHESVAFLERHAYREAALSLLELQKENAKQPFFLLVGRVCQMTTAPEENMEHVCTAYTSLGQLRRATTLRNRLQLRFTKVDYCKPSWLDSYPRLQEIVNIASYTTSVWRQA